MNQDIMKATPRVLVVDDEPGNALLLRRTIEKLDCEVEVCDNGWEAIEKSKQCVFALILLDIIMPDLNGYDTIVRIKSLTLNKETPIFFITGGDSDQESLLRAYNTGAVDFITKPINLNILKRKVNYFLDFYNQKEELRIAKIKSEKLMKSRMSLIANITHELRTPLFAMIGMSDSLSQYDFDPEQKNIVKKIQVNSEHLLDTVNDFLDFSKSELSEVKIENEYFSISKMCEDIIDVMKYQLKKTDKVDLKLSFDHAIPEFIRADKSKIRHILLNLISNALKFTKEGHVTLEVRDIGIKLGSRLMKFVVKDSGIGIPQDKLEKVFEAFTQIDNKLQEEAQGTGLGLSISSKLVDVLGGKLSAKSKEGNGAQFSFSIPYQLGNTSQITEIKESHSLDDLLGDKRVRVLVADDVHDNIFVIKSYLKSDKITLDSTISSAGALHKMRSNTYDIILLDINMPGKTGFEVAKEYREFEEKEDLPKQNIIALTAFSLDDELEINLDKCGFDNYLMKPVKKDSLYELVVSYSHSLSKGVFTDVSAIKEVDKEPDLDMAELDSDFKEYLPTYMTNKKKEIGDLLSCVENRERDGAAVLCHKILGTARSFGFFKLDRDIEKIHKLTKEDFSNFYEEILKLSQETRKYFDDLEVELLK
jgi:signal transduction histidine kinase